MTTPAEPSPAMPSPAVPSPVMPGPLAAALVFVANAAVLVLEIVSLRLVAPYVGLSLQTSSAVIAAALAAISFGAWAGGRVADRQAPRVVLGPLLALSGLATLLVLPVVNLVGSRLQGTGTLAVLMLALAAIFVPAALMSAVSPLVVKSQLSALSQTGATVGWYSSVGTLGAIVATLATGFVLLEAWSNTTILVGLGLVLVVLGLALSAAVSRRLLVGGAVAAGLIAALTSAMPRSCERETAYHCASVLVDADRPTGRVLQLDTAQHSYVDLEDPTYLRFAYIQAFASVVDAVRPGEPLSVFHLGGGAATLPSYIRATRPGSLNRIVEIDKGVVALAQDEMGLRAGDGLTVDVGDGRIGIREEPADSRDLVFGDAFAGYSVPWHLATREVAQDVDRVLKPEGIYVANVIDYAPNEFLAAELATLRSVFAHVAILGRPPALAGESGGNYVVVASQAPLPLAAVADRLTARQAEMVAGTEQDAARLAGDAEILTDDHAPADQLVRTSLGSGA